MNRLDFSDQKYQTNGVVRDESYKGMLLFTMKDFLSFLPDRQSMYFIPTRLLEDNNNGLFVTQFQLSCMRDTNHP